MLGEGLRVFRISLRSPTLKPNADQWQKGNATVRVDRRNKLEPKWKLFRRHQPRIRSCDSCQQLYARFDRYQGSTALRCDDEIRPLAAHLRPLMPQKTRVGNDRSQGTADVARRRNRNEKLQAGARRSVTVRRKTLIEGPLCQKSNWRYRPEVDRGPSRFAVAKPTVESSPSSPPPCPAHAGRHPLRRQGG